MVEPSKYFGLVIDHSNITKVKKVDRKISKYQKLDLNFYVMNGRR